jgi:effector-binding domain-containing protein
MKIFKYLLFLILIIVIGGAIYFGTKESKYDIKDSYAINAPIDLIFNKVNDFKEWKEWGPWKKEDSTIVFNFAEKTVGEGGSYSWTGEMDGSMQTTKVIENKEIHQDLTLLTPGGERNPKVYWNFEEEEGATKITWGMKGEHTLMDKVYYAFSGMDFEGDMHTMNMNGLKGIETSVLEDMKQFTVDVTGISDYGGGYYLYVTASSKMSDLSMKMGAMFGEVMGFVQQNNLQTAGMPFTIYNQIDEANGTVIFSTALPVKENIITPEGSNVLCGYLAPTSAVKTILNGNYTNLDKAYNKAKEYIKKQHLIVDTSKNMFEIYANDPGMVSNPANWTTEVYIPVFKDLRSNHPIISQQ